MRFISSGVASKFAPSSAEKSMLPTQAYVITRIKRGAFISMVKWPLDLELTDPILPSQLGAVVIQFCDVDF